jgi:hypothetical protein
MSEGKSVTEDYIKESNKLRHYFIIIRSITLLLKMWSLLCLPLKVGLRIIWIIGKGFRWINPNLELNPKINLNPNTHSLDLNHDGKIDTEDLNVACSKVC